MVLLDGSAVAHMVRPSKSGTFKEYVPHHVVPFLRKMLSTSVQRIDVLWDTYPEGNIKAQTQAKHGNVPRTLLGPGGSSPIPKRDWNKYLSNQENKKELFPFISEQLSEADFSDTLHISNKMESVLSNQPCNVTDLQPCNHAEADTRILLHLKHGVMEQGHARAYIRTVDSDVVVIAIGCFDELQQLGLQQLRIGLGSKTKYRDVPVHQIFLQLGVHRSLVLPLFYSLTGCDNVTDGRVW